MTAPFSSCMPPAQLSYGGTCAPSAGSNAIAGRYDNLPPSVGYPETAALPNSQLDYAGQRNAGSLLERQYRVIEPSVTPACLGAMPNTKRGTGVQLMDPLTADEFKPKRREREFVSQAQGDTRAAAYTPAHIEEYERALQTNKNTSGHGAMDGHTFTPDEPDNPTNALRNFGNAELKEWRTGGYHPRTRIIVVPGPTKSGGRVDCGAFRFGNASHAIGKAGSIYQTGTAPLGAMRLNPNTDVREVGRVGMAGGGPADKGIETRSLISLQHQNRDNGLSECDDDNYSRREGRAKGQQAAPEYNPDEFQCIPLLSLPNTQREYAGAGGRAGGSVMAPRADLSHQVRGRHAANTELLGSNHRAGAGLGSYAAADLGTQLQDHSTQREGMTECVNAEPAPFRSGMSSYAFERDPNQRLSGVREVSGRAAGASSGYNMSANGDNNQCAPASYPQRSEGAFAQAYNFSAPVATRTTGIVQRSETDFRNQDCRRGTPQIQQCIDTTVADQLRNNPYVQPLPPVY